MGNPLQDRRTAAELASVGQLIDFNQEIGSFEGLAAIVEADLAALDADKIPSDWRESTISGELKFGYGEGAGRIPMVSGHASTRVDAVCQRCLEPFKLKLEVEPDLLLLDEEQADEGYEDFEVWELEEATVRPQDIIEELMIMALPFAAMHDNMSECKALSSYVEPQDETTEDLQTPFAALRSQMTQNEKDPE